MSCNISIPLQEIIDDVATALAGNYISVDNPFLNEAVLTDTTLRGDLTMDTEARNALCALIETCDITADALAWLSEPEVENAVAVSRPGGVVWESLDDVVSWGNISGDIANQVDLASLEIPAENVLTADGSNQEEKNSTYDGYGDAGGVVYQSDIPNTVPQTVASVLSARTSLATFGAYGKGVVDETSQIRDAIASGVPLFAPYGTYLCEGVSLNDIAGVDLEGDTRKPKFVMSKESADLGNDMFKFLLTDTRTATLSASIIKNQSYIDFVSTATISVGDTIQIVSSNFWKYDPRDLYYGGEIHRVTRVDGNRVYIADFTRDSYALGETQPVMVWTPSRVNISNIDIEIPLAEPGISTVGIHHDGGLNDSFHNVSINGSTFVGILTSRSIDTQITRVHGEDIGYPDANGYVIQDRGGLGTRMSGITSVGSRKLFDASSNSGANSSVCRDWSIDDFDAKGGGLYYPVEDETQQNYGIGTHGSSENGRISNGQIADVFIGINPRGKDLSVENVKFIGRVNTCFEGTFGAGLTINNCKADGDIGTFLTLSNASGTGDWDFSRPVELSNNTINGLKTAFINFAGPRTNITNLYARSNVVTTNVTTGDACMFIKCVNQYLSKSTLEGNTIRAATGTTVPKMYSSGLTIGYHDSEKDRAVYMGNNTYNLTVLDGTVATIPRFARDNGSRPIVSISADSGGYAMFVMRPTNATLTPITSTITGYEGYADGTALTGTTGNTGVQTLALSADGTLYIENRAGSTRNYRISSV